MEFKKARKCKFRLIVYENFAKLGSEKACLLEAKKRETAKWQEGFCWRCDGVDHFIEATDGFRHIVKMPDIQMQDTAEYHAEDELNVDFDISQLSTRDEFIKMEAILNKRISKDKKVDKIGD
jgi:hypothetical protein